MVGNWEALEPFQGLWTKQPVTGKFKRVQTAEILRRAFKRGGKAPPIWKPINHYSGSERKRSKRQWHRVRVKYSIKHSILHYNNNNGLHIVNTQMTNCLKWWQSCRLQYRQVTRQVLLILSIDIIKDLHAKSYRYWTERYKIGGQLNQLELGSMW